MWHVRHINAIKLELKTRRSQQVYGRFSPCLQFEPSMVSNHSSCVSAPSQPAKFLITVRNSQVELPFIYIWLRYSCAEQLKTRDALFLKYRPISCVIKSATAAIQTRQIYLLFITSSGFLPRGQNKRGRGRGQCNYHSLPPWSQTVLRHALANSMAASYITLA